MKITKKKIIWVAGIGIVVLFSFLGLSGKDAEEATFTAVKKDLREEVSATGTISSRERVELAFEKSGRVQTLAVSIGDSVTPGKVLLSLERGVETANLEEARATLKSREAKLAELKRGTRPEQLKITEAKLAAAVQTLAVYNDSIGDTVDNALTKAETAVYQYTENIFFNDRTTAPKFAFSVSDDTALKKAEAGRVQAEAALRDLSALKEDVQNGVGLSQALSLTKPLLFIIQDFLIAATNAINNSVITDAEKVTYTTDLSTARSAINGAITSVATLAQNIALSEADVETMKREFELESAGTTPEEIARAEADVLSAEALVASAEATLSQKILRSPIYGTITAISVDPGEIVGANEPVITVINTNSFEIEAYLPEADVAKIQKGQFAQVTLDAYGSTLPLSAVITSIEPAATTIDGVPTYKTLFAITTSDDRIKSGMTSNITIAVAERLGAVAIPERAILFDEEKNPYVYVKTAAGIEEMRQIETGLRGTLGDIEIISGLAEGDTIIIKNN